MNPPPANDITGLKTRVADFKKQTQLLLERFLRGEISQAAAQAEAKRIEREVAKAEQRAAELEVQDGTRNRQHN